MNSGQVMNQAIISVHMPKVAGTSFLHQLKKLYGEEMVLLDYNDDPSNPLSIVNIDPNYYDVFPVKTIAPYKVVHGHFHPHKYINVNNAFWLTFLRHPIANVKSIYDFWSAHEKGFWDHPIFEYFKAEQLSLIRFAMIPAVRYLYTQSYFGGFDMTQFDFIGDYARYDDELLRLGNRLGANFDLKVRHNTTAEYFKDELDSEYSGSAISDVEHEELAQILKKDINFYTTYKGR